MNYKYFKKFLMAFVLCFCLVGILPAIKSEAAAVNVMKSAKTLTSKNGGWREDAKGWWYRYKNGTYVKNSWNKINENIYYFNSAGYAATGWVNYKSDWYYMTPSGEKEGALVTGWKTIGGKKYYISKSTGAMLTGWQTISGKKYYLSKGDYGTEGTMVTKKWVSGKYLQSNGVMATNMKVGNYYVDKNGNKITSPALGNDSSSATPQYKDYIFVGDSRTVGMQISVGKGTYIAKVGEGYDWLVSKAIPSLQAKLKANPYVKVVLNLGVNDCIGNVNAYIAAYKKLFAEYPQTKFYIMSVNPVDDKLMTKYGYYVRNKHITPFNTAMKKAFLDKYMDCYTYLKSNGFKTTDGLHYTEATYSTIYNYITLNAK